MSNSIQTTKAGERTQQTLHAPGTKVKCNGYEGTIVRHYDGDMYEISVLLTTQALLEVVMSRCPSREVDIVEIPKTEVTSAIWFGFLIGTYKQFGLRAAVCLASPLANMILNWRFRKSRLEFPKHQ
jgi:hypothetical protein